MPFVGSIPAVGKKCAAAIKEFSVHAIINIGTQLAAVAKAHEAASRLRAATTLHEQPLRVPCFFGGDVNHSVDGVGSPQSRSWSADHFDAIEILQKGVLDVPKYSCV